MNWSKLKQLIIDADANGTLITQKHDPKSATTIIQSFRSVVSDQVADNLMTFINDEDFEVSMYENTNFPFSPLYITITPSSGSTFNVPASGVTGNVPTSTMDTLILVSGGTQGIHMFGNSSMDINTKISSGVLINQTIIKSE